MEAASTFESYCTRGSSFKVIHGKEKRYFPGKWALRRRDTDCTRLSLLWLADAFVDVTPMGIVQSQWRRSYKWYSIKGESACWGTVSDLVICRPSNPRRMSMLPVFPESLRKIRKLLLSEEIPFKKSKNIQNEPPPSRSAPIAASLPIGHGHSVMTPERKHRVIWHFLSVQKRFHISVTVVVQLQKQQNDDYVKLIREQDLSDERIAAIPIPVPQALSLDPSEFLIFRLHFYQFFGKLLFCSLSGSFPLPWQLETCKLD